MTIKRKAVWGSRPVRPDLHVENHGSVFLLVPRTRRGDVWLREHVQAEPWQWFGQGLACEPRYAYDVAQGALADGLRVT